MRNRIISAVVAAVVVVVAALWFSDTLRIPTDGPSFANAVSKETPTPDSTSKVSEPAHRPLTPTDPLRLWIGGDSLAGALGPSLGDLTAATGIVQPQYDSRLGSGLLEGVGEINWLEHAQEQMDELNPEVVVFIIGTNDASVYDESQAQEYAQLTEQMMRILVGDGREVYWVNAPVMRDHDLEERVLKVDEIQRSVAAMFPDVTFVDAHTLFADETGEYVSSLPDETGDNVQMRAGDGIHFSDAGGDHLAREIYQLMDPGWKISQQQVPGQPKKVLVTRGSTQVPGSSGSNGSSSGSGSSSNSSSSYRSNSSSSNGSASSSGSGTTTTIAAPAAPPLPPPSTTPPPASSSTTLPLSTTPTT
jgi:lysophospholipase L1-like esterase